MNISPVTRRLFLKMAASPVVTALALGVVWVILQDVAALPHGRFLNLDQEWAMFKQIHKKAYASNNTEARSLLKRARGRAQFSAKLERILDPPFYLDLHHGTAPNFQGFVFEPHNVLSPNLAKKRRRVWEANMQMIVQHNLHADRGMHSFRLGINHLGDMTRDEIVDSLNGFTTPNSYDALQALRRPAPANRSASARGLPQTLDWRLQGFVTPVKNQGRCGSCWAFSSAGALEGQHFRKTGELTSLSAQNLIDCSFTDGNNGCSGGTMNGAFSYIYKNKGINTEQSYPYQGQNEKCRFRVSYVGATDNGFVTVTPQGSEDALKAAVALVGPISVAIDASQSTFHFYKSGVYYDETCKSEWVSHGMLVVGYGHSIVANREYWLVKNSWGEMWGQQGYILMARNRGNACGIASMASYPIV